MQREPWFQRTFAFDLPVGRFPIILDRLRGMPARVRERIAGVSDADLRRRFGDTWSILENIGHLTDLEALHLARLDELEAGAAVLRAADLENKATWAADHNARQTREVLGECFAARRHLLDRLEGWPVDKLEVSGLHPRLMVQMRVIDLALFVAEHDDYHLARMHELLAMIKKDRLA